MLFFSIFATKWHLLSLRTDHNFSQELKEILRMGNSKLSLSSMLHTNSKLVFEEHVSMHTNFCIPEHANTHFSDFLFSWGSWTLLAHNVMWERLRLCFLHLSLSYTLVCLCYRLWTFLKYKNYLLIYQFWPREANNYQLSIQSKRNKLSCILTSSNWKTSTWIFQTVAQLTEYLICIIQH